MTGVQTCALPISRGVPEEAFVTMPGDDKDVAALLRQQNKAEHRLQTALKFDPEVERQLDEALKGWKGLDTLPEHTPEQVEAKRHRFEALSKSAEALWMEQLAAIPIAQFYIPKVKNRPGMHVTEEEFRAYWKGARKPQSQATAEAWAVGERKRFFHWFMAFPEVMDAGGFDCILRNPPYLGGQDLSGSYGHPFCHYSKWEYAPAGLSDLVVFFVRRIFSLLRFGGFMSFLTTNSIKDGDVRRDGLEQLLTDGGQINHAVRAIKWPGRAKLVVSTVTLHKGSWNGPRVLDGQTASTISANGTYFGIAAIADARKQLIAKGEADLGSIGWLVTKHPNHLSEGQPAWIVKREAICINAAAVSRGARDRPKRWSSSTC